MVYFHVLLLYCFVSKLSYYLLKNGQLPLLILWSRSSTVVHTYFPLYDCSLLLRSVHEQFLRTMWLYFLPFSLDLNLAEYIINRKMWRLRRGCQGLPGPDVGYGPMADTFLVSCDSFKTLQFPVVSVVEMKIYGRLLQALPFFPTTHTHSSFCVLLLRL